MKRGEKDFYQGAAAVLGALAREHGHPHLAVLLMHDLGITMEQLVGSGAERFDLDPLQAEWEAKR